MQEQSWFDFIHHYVDKEIAQQQVFSIIQGRTNKDTLSFLFQKEPNDTETAFYADVKEKLYRKLCLSRMNEFKLAPGAERLLNSIREKNIALTIATASQKPNVDFFIEHLELDRWFDPDKIICDDGTFPGKPAPDIYLRASAMIGIKPQNCIVFEDSKVGMEAAKKACIGKIICVNSSKLIFQQSTQDIINSFSEINLDGLLSS